MKKYIVDVEVYNVAERMAENGIEGYENDPNWYEYEATLLDKKTGRIVDQWDSLTETYNGVQRLTKQKAKESAAQVKRDVENGYASRWFTLASDEPVKKTTKRKATKTTKRRSPSHSTVSMRGVRS